MHALTPRDAGSLDNNDLGAAAGNPEIIIVDERKRAVAKERHPFGLADHLGKIRAVEPQRLGHRG